MKAGVVIDNWKLPVFRKRLTENSFKYEDGGALTGDTTLLIVHTTRVVELGKLCKQCQEECGEEYD